MKFKRLLTQANSVYDDGILTLKRKFHKDGYPLVDPNGGDLLADFIVQELWETFDALAPNKAQWLEAARVMENARYQLEDLQVYFEDQAERCGDQPKRRKRLARK